MTLSAIILAAGKSTRMKSALPKPLHEVCGKPMLHYVLQACYDAGCARVIVVIGHGKDEITAEFGHDKRITWVEQSEQLGTGHAARMCAPELEKHPGDVFILAGDGPLIRGDVLKTLLEAHKDEKAAASMATAILDDPYGYGRIIRDANGEFVEIIEQGDATPEQLQIKEVFPSYYCVRTTDLLHALGKLKNENSKREYYLTDIYKILRDEKKKVVAVQAVTAEDVLSVNTRAQQAEVDAIMQDRIQRQLRDGGVTIVSPMNTYVESGVTIGQDTIVRPFSFIGAGSVIGRDCVIGPFACVPRDSVVREGSTIAGEVSSSGDQGIVRF
jgi:bifunctional UDP-N-acetylglucosamine pyrophosphorylase/glucosamine-1-phosphate N-acetyltransferase